MNTPGRVYRYVGPPELRPPTDTTAEGWVIRSCADLDAWASELGSAECAEPFTSVVGLDGLLRLAPRRSEHVACAGGRDMPAAGEMGLHRVAEHWSVHEVSNQSTGYCPDLDSWHAVARALDWAGALTPAVHARGGLPAL